MTNEITDLPPALARLDDLLAEVGEDSMVLSELEGFLCGVLVSPDPIALDEWWPFPWLSDGREVIGAGHEEMAALVRGRLAAIEQELADGQYAPLYEVDEDSGAVIWQLWLMGFETAMQLRFDAWEELLRHPYEDVRGEAATRLGTALLLAQPDFGPDDSAAESDWADYDEAMAAVPENLAIAAMLLYQANIRD